MYLLRNSIVTFAPTPASRRHDGELQPVPHTALVIQHRQGVPDRLVRDPEIIGDLGVRPPRHDAANDPSFPRCQLRRRSPHVPSSPFCPARYETRRVRVIIRTGETSRRYGVRSRCTGPASAETSRTSSACRWVSVLLKTCCSCDFTVLRLTPFISAASRSVVPCARHSASDASAAVSP